MTDREQTRRDAICGRTDLVHHTWHYWWRLPDGSYGDEGEGGVLVRCPGVREQTRRNAEPRGETVSRKWRGLGHSAVTEGVNLAYVDQMRRALYAAADAYDALLAELEQAKRERDEAVALADDQNAAASLAAFRLAKVPALVNAARNAYLRTTDETIKALGIALADYEQEPCVPS